MNEEEAMNMEVPSKPVSLTRTHLFAMFANKLSRTFFSLVVFSFMAWHFSDVYGGGAEVETTIAWIQWLSTPFFIAGLARPFISMFADGLKWDEVIGKQETPRFRRKVTGVLGNACFVIAAVLLLGVDPFSGTGVLLLVVAGISYSTGDSLVDVAYDSWLLDLAGDDESSKDKGRAWMRAGVVIGQVLGFSSAMFFLAGAWSTMLTVLLVTSALSIASLVACPEKPASRSELVTAMQAKARPVNKVKDYRAFIFDLGLFILLAFVAGSMVNVMEEPLLIARFGTTPGRMFQAELFANLVALAIIGLVLKFKEKGLGLKRLLILFLGIAAWYYVALACFTPNLGWYMIWNTVKVVQSIIIVLLLDRIIMDVVAGNYKGSTFQVFYLFVAAGGLIGNMLGAVLLGVLGFTGLLVLAASILVACAVAYAGYFSKKIDAVSQTLKSAR